MLTRTLDVRNLKELTAWLRMICEQEKVDLVIVNAGVNTNIGAQGAGELWEDVQALIEVNVLAAMATVDAVQPSMRARGDGQIALICPYRVDTLPEHLFALTWTLPPAGARMLQNYTFHDISPSLNSPLPRTACSNWQYG